MTTRRLLAGSAFLACVLAAPSYGQPVARPRAVNRAHLDTTCAPCKDFFATRTATGWIRPGFRPARTNGDSCARSGTATWPRCGNCSTRSLSLPRDSRLTRWANWSAPTTEPASRTCQVQLDWQRSPRCIAALPRSTMPRRSPKLSERCSGTESLRCSVSTSVPRTTIARFPMRGCSTRGSGACRASRSIRGATRPPSGFATISALR